MKIGIDARLMGVAQRGIGRYIEELLREGIEVPGHEWWVIVREPLPMSLQRANVHEVRSDVRWYSLAEQWRLPRLLASLPVDLIHIPHFNVPLAWTMRRCRPKLVVTIHDLILLEHPNSATTTRVRALWLVKLFGYRLTLWLLARYAQGFITPTRAVKDVLLRRLRIRPEQVEVIPESSRLPIHQCTQECSRRYMDMGPYVLTVGSAYPHKNLSTIMRAFALLDSSRPKWVHVGPRDYFIDQFLRQIESSAVFSSFCYTGQVRDEELSAWYAHAQALLMPSLAEGWGLPIIEAQEQGTRIICSDIPVFREVAGDGAKFISTTDTKGWSEAIANAKKESLGLHRASSPHWSDIAQQTLQYYRQVIESV